MSNSTTCFFPASVYFLCQDGIVDPLKYNSSNGIIFASIIVIVALSPVAVVGNSLVLAAIWKKTFQRTSFHVLLSVLALIDLFAGLVSQPFFCVSYFLLLDKRSEFIHRTALLRKIVATGISSGVYCSGSTICILTFMSVERLLHMTRRSFVTPRRRCFAITVLLLQPNSRWSLGRRGHLEGKGGTRSANHFCNIYAVMLLRHFFRLFQSISSYSSTPATSSRKPFFSKRCSSCNKHCKV